MKFQDGYVYHIKNEYFRRVKDDKLMCNKDHGGYRPALLCFQDEASGILWFVPLSSQSEKYREQMKRNEERYGKCITIVMGEYCGVDAAFLVQNMFPVLPKDVSHMHEVNGIPRPAKRSIFKTVRKNAKKIIEITKRGKSATFTNIRRLERLLLQELEQERLLRDINTTEEKTESFDKKINDAQKRSKEQAAKKDHMWRGPPWGRA